MKGNNIDTCWIVELATVRLRAAITARDYPAAREHRDTAESELAAYIMARAAHSNLFASDCA